MNEQRDQILTNAFLRPSNFEVAGLKLRPFSLATIDLAKRLKLTFLYKDEDELDAQDRSEDEQTRQLVTLLWIQWAEPEEILNAIERNEVARKVDRFKFDVPVRALADFQSLIQSMAGEVKEAVVEVKARDGHTADTDPKALSQGQQ